MMALITLTLKLGQISDEMLVFAPLGLGSSLTSHRSLLRRCQKWQQQERLEKLLTQRRQLIEWWATLPEETACRDLNPAGPLFRCNVHLKLDYCLTRIFIGRPFLFSNVKGIMQPSSHKGSIARSKSRSTLVADCVEAALEIVDLCRLLRDETGLARASYTEFSSCRAALLVILAQSLTKRTERLKNALAQGMGLIKIMSMGVGSARSAVNVIVALERAIRRLEDWSESQAQSRQDSLDSGYELFKNWEMLWKTGPISPVTSNAPSSTNNVAGQLPQIPSRGEASFSAEVPEPFDETDALDISGNQIHLGYPNRSATESAEETPLPHQLDFTHSPTTGLPQTPHFGFEGFISNFPQELDEFNAIPCFDTDIIPQGGTLGVEHDGTGGQGPSTNGSAHSEGRWMSFMNE